MGHLPKTSSADPCDGLKVAYDSIIFDLDGTLWDSTQLCADAWNETLAFLKLKSKNFVAKDIEQIMGLPDDEVFKKLFPEHDGETREKIANDFYVREISRLKNREAVLYPGVIDGIKKLQNSYPLFIVSNCMTDYLEAFFFVTGAQSLFKDAECFGHQRWLKAENIKLICERNQLKAPVYIGDTLGDESSAKSAGVDFFHVTYGFGRALSPLKSFESFSQLTDYFDTIGK